MFFKKLRERITRVELEIEKIKESKVSDSFSSMLPALTALMSNPSSNIQRYEFDKLREDLHKLDKRLAVIESKFEKSCSKS